MDKIEKKRLKEALKEAKRAQKAATKEEKQRKKELIAKAKEEYNAKRCTYYGVLLRCSKLAAPGAKLCERHAKKEAEREERRREKEKYEKERCSYQGKLFGFFWPLRCNDQVVPGKTLCEYHASQETERLRKEAEYRQRVEKAENLKVPTISGIEDIAKLRERYLRNGYCIYHIMSVWDCLWDIERLLNGLWHGVRVCSKIVSPGSPLCQEHTQENYAIVERERKLRTEEYQRQLEQQREAERRKEEERLAEEKRGQASYWKDMVGDGKRFEIELSKVWHKAGYEITELSEGRPDQGVDFIATKDAEKVVVQCKATKDKIGVEDTLKSIGAMTMKAASRCIVASIGGFTGAAYDAVKDAKHVNIELWGLEEILEFGIKASSSNISGANSLSQKEFQEAIEFGHNSEEKRNNLLSYSTHRYYLGVSLLNDGRLEEAKNQLDAAVRLNPSNAEARYCLGIVYEKMGLDDLALEQYEKTLELKPDYADAYLNLGVAYINKGQYDLAMRLLEQAVRIKPDFKKAHELLDELYRQKGR